MMKNSLKGLLISSTVLLTFIGSLSLNTEKVSATPDVVESKTDKKLNEETLKLLKEDIVLTQEKVDKLLEVQESKLQEKQKLSNDISNVKVELDTKQKNIDDLQKTIVSLTNDLKKVTIKLDETSSDLEKAEDKLKHINTEIEERKGIMSKRLRAIQYRGTEQPTVVDALIKADSLNEALNNIISISTIKSAENDMMESLETLEKEQTIATKSITESKALIVSEKEKLDGQYKDLQAKKEKLEKDKFDLKNKEENFKKVVEENEDELVNTSDALKEQQELIDSLTSNIEEVLLNLDAIKDAEHITELNRIQRQLQSYSSSTTLYNSEYIKEDSSVMQQKLMEEAEKYLGTPYVWGGTTPSGFDCSGFTQYVYKQALGISIPRVTTSQDDVGQEVALEDIQVGDLIFWGEPSHHVAIYAGNGFYIHAPSTGDVVKYANRPLTGASYIRRVL